jgi:hypothetical protein
LVLGLHKNFTHLGVILRGDWQWRERKGLDSPRLFFSLNFASLGLVCSQRQKLGALTSDKYTYLGGYEVMMILSGSPQHNTYTNTQTHNTLFFEDYRRMEIQWLGGYV